MNIVYLDLETADADSLWDYGTGFVRLAGFAIDDGPVTTTTDIASVVHTIRRAGLVVGHNVLGFDLPALERYHGLDVSLLVREGRVMDTLLAARQNDPPLSGKADARRYNLDAITKRLGLDGKVAEVGGTVLKALAKEHGGFDRIPVDHPDYVRYLVQDVELVRQLSKHLVVDDYLWREHEVMWRLGHISKHGFRVNIGLVEQLIAGRDSRVQAQKQFLHEAYGLPLKGKKPHTSTDGKVALEKAFVDAGVEPPRTSKGSLATGKDTLRALEVKHADNVRLVELCRALRAFNGERSTAQSLLDHTRTDGRVHPIVAAVQATGRISISDPGLSVMGKRDRGNVCERAMLLPDEGHVLIGADLSQIDARAMAMHCQDEDYIAALEPGKDLHDEMAAAVFGEEAWDRSTGHHPRRADAKAITHATSYGMGAARLAEMAGCTVDDAERQLATLAVRFPRLVAFKDFVRSEGRRQILTNAFGRRMRVQPGMEYTQAPAHMGQGTARDLMMEGILRLPEWLLPCLRAIVHDEIVLSVPESRADEAETAVLDALQFMYRIEPGAVPVPVLADKSDRGQDWADCYRSEKPEWPEVARDHRDQRTCKDSSCTWHIDNKHEKAGPMKK